MMKTKRYIIPIILIKILFALLILQLFFTSCTSDLYDRNIYSDGPIFEIAAEFGEQDSIFFVGDTLYLDIIIEDVALEDKISGDLVLLDQCTFNTEFAIEDSKGNKVLPTFFAVNNDSIVNTGDSFKGRFEYKYNTSTHYRVGFVFNTPNVYSFYFINTPNHLTNSGETDINFSDGENAYANYLLDMGKKTNDYGINEIKQEILNQANFDQAIKDFIVVAPKN